MGRARPEFDPFKPEGGYDPDAFYIASSDAKGHSDYLQVRLPKGWKAAIQAQVDTKQLGPIRSTGDWIRNALVHALAKNAHVLQPSERQKVDALVAIESFRAVQVWLDAQNAFIGELAAALETNRSDREGLAKLLAQVEDILDAPEFHQHHRDQAADLMARYGPTLRRIK